jgi:hypothetical protein
MGFPSIDCVKMSMSVLHAQKHFGLHLCHTVSDISDPRRGYHSIISNTRTPSQRTPPNPTHAFAFPFPAGLPRFFPCEPAPACSSPRPSAAFILSSSCLSIVSRASFRRARSMTSSGFIALRPPCLEKTSRSRAVLAVCVVSWA